MPTSLTGHSVDTLRHKAEFTYTALAERYGIPVQQRDDDPLEELIHTILSANTTDTNSGLAFDRLKAAFNGDWDAVRRAPLDAIKEPIRVAGMYNQKAPNIVGTLERIYQDRGNYDLSFLETMEVDKALAYLTALPGVGRKTASIVLLFCFNRPVFPVDTHIQRVSRRLGIAAPKASPDRIALIWESLMPGETYYPLHINLIRHGRDTCRALDPKCEVCPLQSVCDYFQGEGAWTRP